LTRAQALALKGDIDSALTELAELQAEGDVLACAALAEIAAFRGRWAEVLKHAEPALNSPSTFYSFNVYQDLILLLARAARETKKWAEVDRLVKLAKSKLPKGQEYESHREAVEKLREFVGRKGKGRHFSLDGNEETEVQKKAKFERALDLCKNKKFSSKAERLDHLFALARVYDYRPGAIHLFNSEKALPCIFDNVVFVCSALAQEGRKKEAINGLLKGLPEWQDVEVSQIAPVALLTDEFLGSLMTDEICKKVLKTKRGR
jgi:hypothetical protein